MAMTTYYLSREQLGRIHGIDAHVKTYAKKGLLPEPDIEIGGDALAGEVPGLDPDKEAEIRTRPGYYPVTAVAWERPGRGAREWRASDNRMIRDRRGAPAGYSPEQLEAAAKVIEAAAWVVVHLRREPRTTESEAWQRWNELYEKAFTGHRSARAELAALFSDHEIPSAEHILGIG